MDQNEGIEIPTRDYHFHKTKVTKERVRLLRIFPEKSVSK
jgi:hypothetical protein